jgi:Zn-dependent protease
MDALKLAVYIGVALFVGLDVREYVRAWAAGRLGDPSPVRWGRRTLNPRAWFDPFGSGLLPALLLILIASGLLVPPFAYAKPLPLDRNALRRPDRDITIISLAGPLANLVLAAAGGLLLRLGLSGEAGLAAFSFLWANLVLCVFNLMPIPGLDGARIVARFLPPHPRGVYENLDQYLVLFILVIFFLLTPLLGIVHALANGLCRVLAGAGNCGL